MRQRREISLMWLRWVESAKMGNARESELVSQRSRVESARRMEAWLAVGERRWIREWWDGPLGFNLVCGLVKWWVGLKMRGKISGLIYYGAEGHPPVRHEPPSHTHTIVRVGCGLAPWVGSCPRACTRQGPASEWSSCVTVLSNEIAHSIAHEKL